MEDYGAFLPTVPGPVVGATRDPHQRPMMLLIKRSFSSAYTRNKRDNQRQWSDEFATRLVNGLQSAFPTFEVVMYRLVTHCTSNTHIFAQFALVD